ITADAPLADMPIFIKAGSIIPCGPEIQYASEKSSAPVRLYVYTGGNGTFSLYEDEDTNYNYEKGKFSTIPMTYDEKSKTLTIGKREGEFPGMLQSRSFEIVWTAKQKQAGLDFGRKADVLVRYDGSEQHITMK
ncbi:MAG TPA: DUF5110 domain-containing protein, partial [Bacteroidota bacterium]|nr:DUF5110 domain-containing protein [Bacteroidota bacterium]